MLNSWETLASDYNVPGREWWSTKEIHWLAGQMTKLYSAYKIMNDNLDHIFYSLLVISLIHTVDFLQKPHTASVYHCCFCVSAVIISKQEIVLQPWSTATITTLTSSLLKRIAGFCRRLCVTDVL